VTGAIGPLVLASRSPQRSAILTRLGIAFETLPTGVAEIETGDPETAALENARRKARAAREQRPDALVLGVDTVVALAGHIHGEPADEHAARATLRALSGTAHLVTSAIVLLGEEGERSATAHTRVRFRDLDTRLIERYIASGEWAGRAGAYAIQGLGALLVREIHGEYENVVGLPVATLLDLCPELL
jgi:nucleoside triphosphate pyrophosphatase